MSSSGQQILDIIPLAVEEDGPVGDVEDGETEREHDAREAIHGDGPHPPQLLQVERCFGAAVARRRPVLMRRRCRRRRCLDARPQIRRSDALLLLADWKCFNSKVMPGAKVQNSILQHKTYWTDGRREVWRGLPTGNVSVAFYGSSLRPIRSLPEWREDMSGRRPFSAPLPVVLASGIRVGGGNPLFLLRGMGAGRTGVGGGGAGMSIVSSSIMSADDGVVATLSLIRSIRPLCCCCCWSLRSSSSSPPE